MDNDKRPAFPVNDQSCGIDQKGLTKREYFIAHAPKEIPGWFYPQMPPLPKKPPYVSDLFGENSSHPYRGLFRNYYFDEGEEWTNPPEVSIPEKLKDDVAEAVKNIKEWSQADSEWYRKRDLEKVIQWPIFWADEILKKLS